MAALSPNKELIALLCRSCRGCIYKFGDQGPKGSVEWNNTGQPTPVYLLLHDLEIGSLPPGFDSDQPANILVARYV